MYVLIKCGEELRHYRVVRGGIPESHRVLLVQQASYKGGKLRAVRGLPCQRVKVIATDDLLGEKDIPTITVTWMGVLQS